MKRFALASVILLLMSGTLLAQPAPELKVQFGSAGIESLQFGGTEMLVKSPFGLSVEYLNEPLQANVKVLNTTGTGASITRTFEGVTIKTDYQVTGNRLNIDLNIRNDSSKTISRVMIKPMRMQFSRRPMGQAWQAGYNMLDSSYGGPAVAIAAIGANVIAVCQEGVEPPANVGFTSISRGGREADVSFETLGRQVFDEMKIAAGSTIQARMSIRFAPAGVARADLVGDVHRAYAEKFPATLKWNDNRPIGALFLARDNMKLEKNPRGWFGEAKLDITTDAGKEDFRKRVMAFADNSIKVINNTNGQGMITWDIEGGEFPHATTYLGDPRSLPFSAPEMDAIADEYFKKFLDAGLKTGICIRPTTIVPADAQKYPWIKTRLGHMDNVDALENICDKIAYAKKRWGCTLFYMDTPGLFMKRGEKATYFQIPVHILRKVHERHPDILLFPEFADDGAFGVGSRYGEFGANFQTSEAIRLTYPKAFTCWAIKDNPLYPNWDSVVTGVGNGDILIFRGWFGDHLNSRVRQAWTEASYRGKPLQENVTRAGSNVAQLAALFNESDPVVRYQAAIALGKTKSPEAVAVLASNLKKDSEWAVRRACVESMGNLGGAAAVSAVREELVKPKGDLVWFAGMALGTIGAEALPALEQALGAADASRWEAVAGAVTRIPAPASVPVQMRILTEKEKHADAAKQVIFVAQAKKPEPALFDAMREATSRGSGHMRTLAAKALRAYQDKRSIDTFIGILESSDKDLYYARKEARYALEEITGHDGSDKTKRSGEENATLWRKVLGLKDPAEKDAAAR